MYYNIFEGDPSNDVKHLLLTRYYLEFNESLITIEKQDLLAAKIKYNEEKIATYANDKVEANRAELFLTDELIWKSKHVNERTEHYVQITDTGRASFLKNKYKVDKWNFRKKLAEFLTVILTQIALVAIAVFTVMQGNDDRQNYKEKVKQLESKIVSLTTRLESLGSKQNISTQTLIPVALENEKTPKDSSRKAK